MDKIKKGYKQLLAGAKKANLIASNPNRKSGRGHGLKAGGIRKGVYSIK